jgi:hypothetical protein
MSEYEVDFALSFIEKYLEENKKEVGIIGITGGEPTLHPLFKYIMYKFETFQILNRKKLYIELHTNGSIDIDDKIENKRFISTINIGRSIFHERHKGHLSKVKQYSQMCHKLSINNCVVLRDKGRAKDYIGKNSEFFVDMLQSGCIFNGIGLDVATINFGVDRIRFCGENSHNFECEDNFVKYDEKYLNNTKKLIDKAKYFRYFCTQENCKCPCHLFLTQEEEILKEWKQLNAS